MCKAAFIVLFVLLEWRIVTDSNDARRAVG